MNIIAWDSVFYFRVQRVKKLVFNQPAKISYLDICDFNRFRFEDFWYPGAFTDLI